MAYERARVGRYGRFGGRFVTEALWTPLAEVGRAFDEALADDEFLTRHEEWLDHRVGRPTPISRLVRLSGRFRGGQILLKREDLGQGGSFCTSAAVGQAFLARRMGHETLIADTATGDFGVAVGTVAAALDMEAKVFMGREDHESEPLNVRRMEELGVDVEIVDSPVRGAKAARSEAFRQWSTAPADSMYCASSAAMPDPYPRILAYFLATIGAEAAVQLRRMDIAPAYVVAPVGSGAFASGLFSEFVGDEGVQLVGVQASGPDDDRRGATSLVDGRPGVFQGTFSFLLHDEDGQVHPAHTNAAGLNSPNVAPQHADWAESGRVLYTTIGDDEAVDAAHSLVREEGLIVSLETAHAVAYALKLLPTLGPKDHVLVGCTGEGTRDLERLDPGGGAG